MPDNYWRFDIQFGKDDVQSSNVINDTLLEYLEKASSHMKHSHNPFSLTKQYICRHIYCLLYI